MISGMYMGEIARQCIHEATKKGLLFGGEITEELGKFQRFYSKYISEIEKYVLLIFYAPKQRNINAF